MTDEYNEKLDDYKRRVAKLPEPFQRRFERFQPKENWNRDFLSYELFCLEEAVKIADGVTHSGLSWDDWRDLEHGEKMTVEEDWGIDDGHSGNTHAFAVQMAFFLTKDDRDSMILNHGGIAMLVGCDEFGCPPGYNVPPEDAPLELVW